MSLKFTEELCVMAKKNDAKLTQGRNLMNFDSKTQKSKEFIL